MKKRALLFAFLIGSLSAVAQQSPDLANGLVPYGSFQGGEIDSLNLNNGNLTLHIPLVAYPQRGKLSLSFIAVYNNKGNWQQHCYNPGTQNAHCNWEPKKLNGVQVVREDVVNKRYTYVSDVSDSFVTLSSSDAASHELGSSDGTWGGAPWFSLDATAMKWIPGAGTDPGYAIFRNGVRQSFGGPRPYSELAGPGISYPLITTDPNGNQISINASTGDITDTIGRIIPALPGVSSTTSNCPAGTTSASAWNLPGVSGGTATFKFCNGAVSLQTNFGGGALEYSGTVTFLKALVLPDGTMWQFSYDSIGQLSQITFPTGGTLAYTWTSSADTPRVLTRTLNANNGQGNATWNYNIPIAGYADRTTVVTDPLGNDTDHVFHSLVGEVADFETETRYYKGTGGSRTLLKTVQTSYSSDLNPVDTYFGNGTTAMNVVPSSVKTIWPNSQQSQVTKTYDSGETFTFCTMYSSCSSMTAYPLRFGNVVAEDVFDYGNNAPGTKLRTSQTRYVYQDNSSYRSANLLEEPSWQKILSPAGNLCSEVDYTYDDPARLAGSNITTQHVAAPSSARGNISAVTSWKGTFGDQNCTLSGTSSQVTSYNNVYDTGMLYQSIDPLSHTTTLAYSQTYLGAYVTQTTNALGQSTSATYDFNSGLVTGFTDQNGNGSAYTYDSMFRLVSADFPDGGRTTFALDNPTTLHKQQKIDDTPRYLDHYSYFDGVGRPQQTRLVDPSGDVYSDTQFDALGRKWKQSNPYRSLSDTTYGVTESKYDTLGRAVKVIPTDGSDSQNNATSLYDGNATTVTDQTGRQRRMFADALGRLVQVDEPGGVFAAAAGSSTNLSIIGTEQSTTTTAAYASGSVTISGTEQSATDFTACDPRCPTVWDTGTVTITVNGSTKSATYLRTSTSSTIATALRTAINGDSAYPVSAGGTGGVVSLTAKQIGAVGNYSLSSGSTTDRPDLFVPSFSAIRSGATLTGGANASTTYDAGSVTLTIGGQGKSVSFGQTSTSSSIASALASAFNSDPSSLVSIVAAGATLNVTSKGVGAVTNYAWNTSSVSTQGFAPPSFSASSTAGTMTGGSDAGSGLQTPWTTYYTYDPLGNLWKVEQRGGETDSTKWRVRTFLYDSLGRLLVSNNPETGQISWTYDDDGNVLTKTALAANQSSTGTATVTINYDPADSHIDPLHRVTKKTYSNGEPSVTYVYDQTGTYNGLTITNGIGRRTSMSDGSGQTFWAYDQMGRVLFEKRTISGATKVISKTYNKDGSQDTLTYPSGRTLKFTYDTAGKLLSEVDQANGINYVTNASYSAAGALTSATLGGTINVSNTFNKRLQPIFLTAASSSQTLLSLAYDYKLGISNNGNVIEIRNDRDTQRNQTFTYDQLNRVTSAQSAGTDCSVISTGIQKNWGNSFTYDSFANLLGKTVTKCQAEFLSVSVDNKNHITSTGFDYDAAGNLKQNGSATYTYDAEYRIASTNGVTYTYDGDGIRVKKSSGTLYWGETFTGGPVAESDASGNMTKEFVYFNGQRVARRDISSGNVHYYLSDHLQSASIVASAAGVIEEESDFYPFGGERPIIDTLTDQNYKFTSKERDTESGLDYFGARYYAATLGRFMTPDWSPNPLPIPYARLNDPQTLNLYSFVENNPLNDVDLDGHAGATLHITITPNTITIRFCDPKSGCKIYVIERQQVEKKAVKGLLKQLYTLAKIVDAFNNNPLLGVEGSDCAKGGSCSDAAWKMVGGIVALVASRGMSGDAKAAAFVEKEIAQVESKLLNIATKDMTRETLEAAARESSGGMKVAKNAGGVAEYFDHVGKIERAINGLNGKLKHLERLAERPGLSELQEGRIKGLIGVTKGLLRIARSAIGQTM